MSELNAGRYAYCVHNTFSSEQSGEICFPEHYLAYSAAGSMRLAVDSRYYYLQPSKAVLIPAQTKVIADIASEIVCCSVLFGTGFFSQVDSVQTIDLTPLAKNMILHCSQWGDKDVGSSPDAMRFFSALADVIAERLVAPNTDWVPRGSSELVSSAIDLTVAQHVNAVEIGDIAGELAMSPRNLSRRIVEETGMKWSHILRRIRMIRARELFSSTDIPATHVAEQVGYQSQSAFNRAFKVETGMTPREFITANRLINDA